MPNPQDQNAAIVLVYCAQAPRIYRWFRSPVYITKFKGYNTFRLSTECRQFVLYTKSVTGCAIKLRSFELLSQTILQINLAKLLVECIPSCAR